VSDFDVEHLYLKREWTERDHNKQMTQRRNARLCWFHLEYLRLLLTASWQWRFYWDLNIARNLPNIIIQPKTIMWNISNLISSFAFAKERQGYEQNINLQASTVQ